MEYCMDLEMFTPGTLGSIHVLIFFLFWIFFKVFFNVLFQTGFSQKIVREFAFGTFTPLSSPALYNEGLNVITF